MMKRSFGLSLMVVMLLLSCKAFSGCPGVSGGQRVDLVIGNSNYQKVTPLANAAHDAEDTATVLRSYQFDVMSVEDQCNSEMQQALECFKQALQPNGVGLFFYSD